MLIKSFSHIAIALLFFKIGFAQDVKPEINPTDISTASFLERTEFKVNYSGNIFWNNGINFGAEYVFKAYQKVKNRKRGQRTNTHQFLFNGNLGFTTNFSSKTDTGIFTNFGVLWRRTNKKGKQFSIAINPLGYYRSFLPETYKVTDGTVDKVFLPGRGYFAPSFSVGIGKRRPGKKITGRFFNINFMLRTPYNAGTLPAFNLQYGYRFNFKKKRQDAETN